MKCCSINGHLEGGGAGRVGISGKMCPLDDEGELDVLLVVDDVRGGLVSSSLSGQCCNYWGMGFVVVDMMMIVRRRQSIRMRAVIMKASKMSCSISIPKNLPRQWPTFLLVV